MDHSIERPPSESKYCPRNVEKHTRLEGYFPFLMRYLHFSVCTMSAVYILAELTQPKSQMFENFS